MPYNLSTMQSIFCNNKEITEITYNGSPVYQKSSGPDYTEPFYVENISDAEEELNIKKMGFSGKAPTLTIEYSTDKTTWNTFGKTSTTALTRTLAPGEKVYLRCTTNKWVNGSFRNAIFGISKIGGNIMSLLYGDSFADKTTFPTADGYEFGSNVFSNTTTNKQLKDISQLLLPAITMNTRSYYQMFSGCTSLTTAPALPATTLATSCYQNMFQGCTALTQAPALPATTLATYCYQNMFSGCTSLTQAPALPATTLAQSCYESMFESCTSLTTAPALPATTLAEYCYSFMFSNCTSLSNVTCLATSGINPNNSTTLWLANVSSTGTFTKAAGTTWPTGDSGIPSDWTVVEV